MFKRKFVRQENIKDCGAACLLMIMRHYGGNYPLEQLREIMGIDREGTTAFNLIKAAEKVGFDARGYKCNDIGAIKCPAIAHVIINKTYHHFVVVDAIDIKKGIITIADPAMGLKRYSFDEFNQIWTHVIITLYPIRKIDNINVIKSARKTIVQLIKPHKKLFVFIFLLSVMFTVFNIANTFYFKIVIDNSNLSATMSSFIFSFFLLITVIRTIIDFLRSRLLAYIDKKIEISLMNDTFKHLLALPWQYFNSRTTGDIVSRLNDLSYVRDLVSRVSIILLVDLILVVGSMIMMCLINCYLFLIAIAILLIYLGIVFIFNHSIKSFIVRNQEAESLVSSSLIETIIGINTVKNLCIEDETYKKVMAKYENLVDNNYRFHKKYNAIKMLKDFTMGIGMTIIIFIGGSHISQGLLSVGDFIMFNFFLNFFLEPMKNIFEVEPLLRSSTNALIRTSEFFNVEKDEYNEVLKSITGDLILRNLDFAYNGRDTIVKNLNLTIKSGEKIMIHGPSGSGKSTIAKMILRYLEVKPNQIMIDGKDTLNYSQSTIRHNICYVSQGETLFTDSLYNNVVLNRDIKDEIFQMALDLTNVAEIMKKHKLDCNMLLEENGSNLSGGERQRIIIARALLKNSKIYIFDESMSEMNADLERNILKKIFSHYDDKTIIVISHRLDNADLYDRVVSINNIKEIGMKGVNV